MSTQIQIPSPTQYDRDGGSSITATVAEVDDMIAILVDRRDAANISAALANVKSGNRDDREALHKLSELLDAKL